MGKSLIIVESPAKAKTIAKYLGKDYVVESSIGHIRDLPSSADEIPEKYKKKPWARTGVDVENGFKPLYIVPAEKKAQVKKLKDLLERADTLYLATDEDREGEAIAWHLKEVLDPQVPTKRMVFHEITEKAIKQALKEPREIDDKLVDAQEARRILDRLYGYEVSPILWRKIAPRLSAGRVQSVATRLIVERERLRIAFKSGEYWSLLALLETGGNAVTLSANVVEIAGKRVAVGKDFDPNTGKLAADANVLLLDGPRAKDLAQKLTGQTFTVESVTKKPFTDKPYAPFITSSLQMEANKKLRFTAQRTMRNAQRLYEAGFITYMRTDSTTLSQQAIDAARAQIEELYGKEYLPSEARQYTKQAKGAQEAHEAIRPAGDTFRTPESLKGELDEDQWKVYDLIWKRTVASQMKDAVGERTQVRFKASPAGETIDVIAQVSGKVIHFPGYMRAYVEGSDDPEAELEDQEKVLPPLTEGQALTGKEIKPDGHQTQPPARFTEASLVKELEDRGIGRPSTYASIIGTIQDRGYVFKKGSALVPTFTAFAVVNLLEQHFKELVDYAFTASMEGDLDAISEGDKKAAPWLEHFYFGDGKKSRIPAKDAPMDVIGLKAKVTGGTDDIDPRAICEVPLGRNDKGELVAARVGRYGPYVQIGDTDKRANIPEDTAPDELNVEKALALLSQAAHANRSLGVDAATGKNVYVKSGRYGPYVQLGELELNEKGKPKGEKPRMASLWPGMTVQDLTLDQAQAVLAFPKTLGKHPTTGYDVTVHDGKFGPYVQMLGEGGAKESRSLTSREQMLALTLDEAVAVLAQPRQPRGRGQQVQAPVATLGESPVTKQAITVRMGRFGAYVTDGVVNATIPSARDPARLTTEEAIELIARREQVLREQGIDPRDPKAQKGRGRGRRTGLPRKAAPAAKAAKAAAKAAAEPKAAKAKPAATKKPAAAAAKKPAAAAKPKPAKKSAAKITKKPAKKRR